MKTGFDAYAKFVASFWGNSWPGKIGMGDPALAMTSSLLEQSLVQQGVQLQPQQQRWKNDGLQEMRTEVFKVMREGS